MIICQVLGIPTSPTIFRRHYKVRAAETNSRWFTCKDKLGLGLFAKPLSIESWKKQFFFVRFPGMPFRCIWTTRRTLPNPDVKSLLICTNCAVLDQYTLRLQIRESWARPLLEHSGFYAAPLNRAALC